MWSKEQLMKGTIKVKDKMKRKRWKEKKTRKMVKVINNKICTNFSICNNSR
jgi:hypothetical protein